jgi:tRNA U38,U39,U40 pseudouridine synthase TruA
MPVRTVQLVLHYDGARFAGWQRQRDARTVQGELEIVLARLCGAPTPVVGAGAHGRRRPRARGRRPASASRTGGRRRRCAAR